MNIYIKKLFEHDIKKQISVTREVLNDFFDVTEEKQEIELVGKNSKNKGQVVFLLATDPRLGGDIKKIVDAEYNYNNETITPLDLLCFIKGKKNNFSLDVITKNDSRYKTFINILNEERHLIINIDDSETNSDSEVISSNSFQMENLGNYQQIYYGAPGTGKSYAIQLRTQKYTNNTVRTTFHPDSDYSSFVGCLKPTMLRNSENINEKKIGYCFTPQVFLKAYINAWKNYPKPTFLIIEEINRGNCAQIFGDLFQLLDRDDEGFSSYPIDADTDIQNFIYEQQLNVSDLNLSVEKQLLSQISSGEKLFLPNNLYIWATMNTSDQSLFPIDSAFKRRWDWGYIPISNANKQWNIQIGNNFYDWWDFVTKINIKIQLATESQDKKLGYFFCKANNDNIIDKNKFVGKVLFYLWNDIFKDYPLDNDDLLKDEQGVELSFESFFDQSGEPINDKVQLFLKKLDCHSKTLSNDSEISNTESENHFDN